MDIENEIQLILTKLYGVKVMEDTKNKKNTKSHSKDKQNKFNIIPFKEFLEKNNLKESKLDLNEFSDEKHYYTTRSIRAKYKEMKDFITGNNPEYKTLIYR